jgi:Tfp pilus assembly PilM family ATPase
MSDAVSYFTREFYKGGDDLTDAISKKLSLEMGEAETLKRSASLSGGSPAGGGGGMPIVMVSDADAERMTSRRDRATTKVPIVMLEKGDSGKYGQPSEGGGGGDADRVMDCINGVLEDICHDINISIDYFENQYDKKVEEVYVTGGASLTLGLPETLERTVQKPVTRWNPLQYLDAGSLSRNSQQEFQDYAAQAAIALGLGARVGG